MKKFHEILLNHAYALVVLLCTSVYAPPWVLRNYGKDAVMTYCFTILLASVVIFAFTLWWLTSDWHSSKPARMGMLYFAAVLGLIISIAALTALYGVLPSEIYFFWREWPAAILTCLVVAFAGIDLFFF